MIRHNKVEMRWAKSQMSHPVVNILINNTKQLTQAWGILSNDNPSVLKMIKVFYALKKIEGVVGLASGNLILCCVTYLFFFIYTPTI